MPVNFDECFRRVSESHQQVQDDRFRLIESVIGLNNVKRIRDQKQNEFASNQFETNKLKAANRELKIAIIKSLIERDELLTKKMDLSANVERLTNQLDSFERESDDMLQGEQVDHACERYSLGAQVSLINKIQDARNKLIKNGFPSGYFA